MHQFKKIQQLPFLGALEAHQENADFAQQIWQAIAPENILSLSNAMSIKETTLYIATEHNSVASKINMLMPQLTLSLSQLKANVTSIKVKVQVKSVLPVNSTKQRKISKNAANLLNESAKALNNTPLGESLARIAKNADKLNDK